MRNKFILLAAFFLTVNLSFGQSFKAFMEAAETAVVDQDYYSAMVYYEYALKFDEDDVDVRYKLADASRNFNAFSTAAKHYTKLNELETNGMYPLSTFYLGEVKQHLGEYTEAKDAYQMYLGENSGDDPYFTGKAQKEIKACEWAMTSLENREDEFNLNHLGDHVNTPYSEFGATMFNEELYYSSLGFEREIEGGKQKKGLETNPKVSKVMKSSNGSSGEVVDGEYKNNQLLTAHTAFTEDNSQVYYTICEYLAYSDIRCDLYVAAVNGDGGFGSGSKLPDFINLAGTTSTQPMISKMEGSDVLFFVSDRSGGKGNLDIWYSYINDGNYSEPVNLSELNTAENDVSPFYNTEEKTLYFSSEGMIGMGGYDVYQSYFSNSSFGAAENMSSPVNSSYDDVYYTINTETNMGYMASNRQGSFFLEESREACCFDVYSFEYTPVELDLIAHMFDKATFDSLPGTTVTLIDAKTGEVIQRIAEGSTEKFKIEKGREYILKAEKLGYTPDETRFDTRDVKSGDVIVKKLYLMPDEIELEVFTFNKETELPLRKCTVDLICTMNGKSDTLRKVNMEDNYFKFRIKRAYDYVVIANRPGFTTDVASISSAELATAKGPVRRDLYLGLDNLNALLPIVLYFDNDHPDPDSWSYNTTLGYNTTYPPYYAKKGEFVSNWTAPLSGAEKATQEGKMNEFFEDEVRYNYEDFQFFLAMLKVALDKGQDVNIYLSGFTSPRYTSKYNYRLGTRRVRSVRNELKEFKEGMFMPYFDDQRLKVSLKSFGETESPDGVIEDMKDERNSIYGIPASKERRTEISEAEVNGSN